MGSAETTPLCYCRAEATAGKLDGKVWLSQPNSTGVSIGHSSYSEKEKSPVGKDGLKGRREKSEKLHGGRELNLSCLAWWGCGACLVGHVVKID